MTHSFPTRHSSDLSRRGRPPGRDDREPFGDVEDAPRPRARVHGVHVLACRNSAAVRFLSQAGGVQRGRGGGVVPAGGARGGGLGDRRLLLYPDRQDDVFRRSRARLRGERQRDRERRSEEHTSELQSLMRISYAVFCLKKKKKKT